MTTHMPRTKSQNRIAVPPNSDQMLPDEKFYARFPTRLTKRILLISVLWLSGVTFVGASDARLEVDAQSGRWAMTSPALSLREAAAGVWVGDKWTAMAGPVQVGAPAPTRDSIGEGEHRVLKARARDGLELSVSVTLYRTGARALVEATVRNVGDKPLVVSGVRAFQGRLATRSPAAECRMLVNSGGQSTSGVFAVGAQGERHSAYVSCLFDPMAKQGLGIGMVSYHRADVTITARAIGERELDVTAFARFSGVAIPPGGTVSSEAILLEWGDEPLGVLEHYADALAAAHKIRLPADREGMWNIWYAYDEKENSEAHLLWCAEYQSQHLVKWGIPWLSTGAWQRDNAFGKSGVFAFDHNGRQLWQANVGSRTHHRQRLCRERIVGRP